MSVVLHKTSDSSGVEKEAMGQEKAGPFAARILQRNAPSYGSRAVRDRTDAGEARVRRGPHAPGLEHAFLKRPIVNATSIDDEDDAHPSRVAAVRTGRGSFCGAPPDRNGRGSAKTVMRAQAVPPIRTAPIQAKTSRQISDGTPICDRPRTAW